MAKKKSAAKKVKAAAPAPVAQPVTAAKPSMNKGMAAVIAVIILFVVVETVVVAQRYARQSKKPEYLRAFDQVYSTGITSLGESGTSLYATDDTRDKVYVMNKEDGKLVKIYELAEGIRNAVESSKGLTYILTKQNLVMVFDKKFKLVNRIPIPEVSGPNWLEIDTQDNFYISDGAAGKIVKYGPDFVKVMDIGSKGAGKGQFKSAGKVHVGADGSVYAIDSISLEDARMNVFDKSGRSLYTWKIANIKKISMLENFVVTPDNNVYFNDFEGSRVVVFSQKGNMLGSFDTDKDKRFLIANPSSIAGGPSGLIYVATHKIGIFNPIKY